MKTVKKSAEQILVLEYVPFKIVGGIGNMGLKDLVDPSPLP